MRTAIAPTLAKANKSFGVSFTSKCRRSRDHRECLQRIAAQVEEVVVHSNRRDPKDLFPYPCQLGFERVAGGDVHRVERRASRRRLRQRSPVDLACRVQWKRRQVDERRRNHVTGKRLCQRRTDLLDRGSRLALRHEISCEPRVAARFSQGHHHRIAERLETQQMHLDLSRLHAKAAHLCTPGSPGGRSPFQLPVASDAPDITGGSCACRRRPDRAAARRR